MIEGIYFRPFISFERESAELKAVKIIVPLAVGILSGLVILWCCKRRWANQERQEFIDRGEPPPPIEPYSLTEALPSEGESSFHEMY